MSATFPKVELGRVLRLRKTDVTVARDVRYQFAGVKSFGGGVFRSAAKSGSDFAYRTLTRVRKNEFVYPKLMAWEGALGVVPVECDGLVVSPEFCVFQVDPDQVEPRCLGLYFKQPRVWPSLAGGSAGTNVRRRRIYPADFLRFEMPLPPLKVQRDILERLSSVFGDVEKYRVYAAASTAALNSALLSEYHRISDLAPRKSMSSVAPLVRRDVAILMDSSYPELGVRSFGRGTFHKPPLAGTDVGSKRLFRILPGDLIFNIVFAWEGAVAVARDADAGRVGSHRFLTCVVHTDQAFAEYLCFHFLTSEGLSALGDASPGGAGRNRTLGLQALAAVTVPVPPLDQQRALVDMLHFRDQILARHAVASERCDALEPELLRAVFEGEFGGASLGGAAVPVVGQT
jgi:type I restriction enzyme S subunit